MLCCQQEFQRLEGDRKRLEEEKASFERERRLFSEQTALFERQRTAELQRLQTAPSPKPKKTSKAKAKKHANLDAPPVSAVHAVPAQMAADEVTMQAVDDKESETRVASPRLDTRTPTPNAGLSLMCVSQSAHIE